MQCRDFERLWNEQLDARDAPSSGVERILEAHASDCLACRATAARYLTLRHVLRVVTTAPAPPAEFAARFLETRGTSLATPPRTLRGWPVFVALSAAAAVLLATFVARRPGPLDEETAALPQPSVKAIDPRSLGLALADARSATWALARETSAPAARIGRHVLDSATIPEATALPMPDPVTPGAEVLQRVGDRVHAGVLPLSGTARHAFGFLLGTPRGDKDAAPPT